MGCGKNRRMIDDQNFANLFRQTPEMVCILAGPEHRFEFVNEAHVRALGFNATGRTVRDAQPESVEVHGILDEVYRTGRTAELRELPVTLTDRVRYFNLTYAARRDASGIVDGIMIMGSEVTEQVLGRQQLTLALESSKVGFYDWNIVHDSITFSPQMQADWGLGNEQRRRTLEDAFSSIHPDDRERAQREVGKAVAERSPYHVEYRVVRPDGTTIWVDVRGRVDYTPDGRPARFFGTSVDISERVEHERGLRFLTDSMPQVAWTARPDGVLDYTNKRWTEYSGSTDPTLWLDFVFPRERESVAATWAAAVKTGERYEAEFRLLRQSDRTYRWHLVRANAVIDETGRVSRWFGTCTDIDDQKRSEDWFRFLADASVVLSGAVDYADYEAKVGTVMRMAVPLVADWAAIDMVEPDGSLTRVALAHSDPAKLPVAEEVYRRWPPTPADASGVSHVVRTGKPEVYPEISEALLLRSFPEQERLRLIQTLGLKSSLCVPLQVRGKVVGAISLVSAESEHRFTTTDLRFAADLARRVGAAIDNAQLFQSALQARQNADEANRLKDEFLATISHELRTPLNAMLGWTRMLRGATLTKERQERALETIERNAVTQAQLIEDLLDVARIVSGKLRLDVQTVGVAHVVEHAIDSLRLASDARKIQILTALDPSAGQIIGDPHRLGQVMWNLLSNAIKFTPRGGRINVTVERVDSSLRISVADTGQGIAPEFLPHVFERFKQEDGATTRTHGGLGLGLAISRHIVELHGGSISVRSKGEGHGSTFTVSLPVSPLRQEVRATSSRLGSSVGNIDFQVRPELVDLRILVVDDEPDARDLVAAVLEQCGAKVTTAASARDALALLERELPDLLLSDIGMPEEDGYSLIRKVRALPGAAHIPAAALTAYARAEDRRKALDAGYMMHIPKPVEPAELVSVIASLTRFAPRKPVEA
jgi:signal transduction histidine kinase/CheY-like chemotaxis protein/PAS domain-containing protein